MHQFIEQNRSFIIVAAVVMLLCLVAAVPAKAQKATDLVPEKERIELRDSMIASCVPSQRAALVNRSMTDGELRKYCTCFAEALFTNLTYGDLEKATQAFREQKPPGTLISILLKGRDINVVGNRCFEAAFK